MKIVIPGGLALGKVDLIRSRFTDFDIDIYDNRPNEDELIKRIASAEIVIPSTYTEFSAKIIDSLANLKYIIVPAVGYDCVDVAYAEAKGIRVLNCPTHNSQAVAEHMFTLLLAVCRNLLPAAESLRRGEWQDELYVGTELNSKRLGLIGHGNIGKRIETIGRSFGLNISYVDSKSTDSEIDNLISNNDIICICAPLTDRSKYMIDERRLGLLSERAILINVSRGAIVDQIALLKALENKKIRAAGLDVFENEPLKGAPSDTIVRLANLPNVVATPHMAYNTTQVFENLIQELIDNIHSCLDGKPVNLVNKVN